LQEIFWRSVLQRHSAREGAVQVHVSVDQPRHDYAAVYIYKLRGRIGLLQVRGGANLCNQAVLDGDAPVLNEGEAIIVSDQPTVPDQQHCRCLRCGRILALSFAVSIPSFYSKN
jgi:hypothetical protein